MIKISQEIKIKLGDDEYILTFEEASDLYNQLKTIVDKTPTIIDWTKFPQSPVQDPIKNPWEYPSYPGVWYTSHDAKCVINNDSSVKVGN